MLLAGWLYARAARFRRALGERPILVGVALFVAAAIAFRWARLAAHWWSIDDSAITYAASFELVDHHSLAPYVEGTPVEGYSNPLLFFLVALLRLVGLFDPIVTHLRLEMIVFAAMVVLVWALLRSVAGELGALLGAVSFTAVELLTPATWVWYGSGLETVWVSAGMIFLVWLCARTLRGVELRAGWGAVVALVAIIRPEAPAYVIAFYVAMLALARPDTRPFREHLVRVARAASVTVIVYAVFLCWRRLAYAAWLPNTYYAKLHGQGHPFANFRTYVLGEVFPYGRSLLFCGSAFALFVRRRTEKLAQCLLVFAIAALALPIAAGADWMGEERFATAFIAMAHLSYATVVAAFVGELRTKPRREWRRVHLIVAGALAAMVALLVIDGMPARAPLALNSVTVAKVAELRGGERWEHQMRLGLPYPVVINPDAGGSLLVGSMQMVDDGFLTDFQMPRLVHSSSDRDARIFDQYQLEERRADLANGNTNFAIDGSILGDRYLQGPDRLWARRDLVEVAALPPDARLAFVLGGVSVYLSSETVPVAAPGALVRCEVIVAWTGTDLDPSYRLRGRIAGGDSDEIHLQPYAQVGAGMERRALLLGAPSRPGTYEVTLELVHGGSEPAVSHALAIEVTADVARVTKVASELAASGAPHQAAARVAWLREQQVPRLGITAYHVLLNNLRRWDIRRSAQAGPAILELRDNDRLATLGDLPAGLRAAELVAIRRVVGECAAGDALCLGRAVDDLRRLGYLGVLGRVPEVSRALAAAGDRLSSTTLDEQYRTLVGITLADPSDLHEQQELLRARRELSRRDSFPAL